jgi:hypothetical protein
MLISILASPVLAQRPSKVDRMKARRAAEGSSKVDQGLTESLRLAKRGNVNSWNTAKKNISTARDALEILEISAATRNNDDTKKYRATLNDRVLEIYMAADGWLPAKLANEKPRSDAYTGSDKERLHEMAEKAWRKKWPNDKIVAIRFGRADWHRTIEEGLTAAGTVGIVKDFQFLELSVYVQESPNIVTGYPAYINRDNLSNSEDAGVKTKAGTHMSHDVPASAF